MTLSIEVSKSWAILIGIGEFTQDHTLRAIPAIESNVTQLCELLADPQIVGIPSDHIISLKNQAHLGDKLIATIEALPDVVDTLILYYVGHGICNLKTKFRLYLATVETRQNYPKNALSFADLWELTHNRATHVIYVLDCCKSGKALERLDKPVGRNISFLTATLPADNALASQERPYTVFTECLLNLLTNGFGTERTTEQTVTPLALYRELKTRLMQQGYPEPWHQDFLDKGNEIHFAHNRAYQPGQSTAEKIEQFQPLMDELVATRQEVKSKDQLIAELKRLQQTSDRLTGNFLGDALVSFHYENYAQVEANINKAYERMEELATAPGQTPEAIKQYQTTAANLATLNADLNELLDDYVKAAEYRMKAAELMPEGVNDEWLVRYLFSTVDVLRKQGHYQKAIPLQQKVLAITERLRGPEHPDVATSLNNLASLYQKQGDYAQAKPLFERSLAILEKVLDKEHPDVAANLNNLALLYYRQGDFAQARPLFEHSLAIRQKVLGLEHPDVAVSLNNLTSLYAKQGDSMQAKPLYERSLAIRQKVLGPEHLDVATSLNNLAILYKDQGNFGQAKPLFERSLAILEKVLGSEHPDVATNLNNLAMLYQDQGNFAQAKPLLERSLAIQEKVLGPEHPDVAVSLNNLAELYRNQGYFAQAKPLYERSLAIWEKVLGKEHPDVAASLHNLAGLYHQQGNLAQTKLLLERCLAINEKVLGKEHPHTQITARNYENLLAQMNSTAPAPPAPEPVIPPVQSRRDEGWLGKLKNWTNKIKNWF